MCQKIGSLSFLKPEFRFLVCITTTAANHQWDIILQLVLIQNSAFISDINAWAIFCYKTFFHSVIEHDVDIIFAWKKCYEEAIFMKPNVVLLTVAFSVLIGSLNVSLTLIPFSLCQVFVTLPSPSLQNKEKCEDEWIKKEIEELWTEKSKVFLVDSLGNQAGCFLLHCFNTWLGK